MTDLHRVSALLSLALLALASGCPAETPPPRPTAAAVPKAATVPQSGTITVLYKAPWGGRDVRLLGVDTDKSVAWLWLAARTPESRLAIDTVDYDAGQRVDRWEASADSASTIVNTYPRFRPLTGTFDEDLQRFADIVRRSGPWLTRARKLAPTVAVAPEGSGVVYDADPVGGRDGDWLYYVPAPGQKPQRVDEGNIASYAPVFSPDGRRLAFTGCFPKAPGKRDCTYSLFSSDLAAPPTRVPQVRKPTAPVFAPDGTSIYTVGRAKGGHTLYRVSADGSDVAPVHTLSGLQESDFAVSDSGSYAVFGGMRGEPGKQEYAFVRIKLSDGSKAGEAVVAGAVGVGILVTDGLHLVPTQRGGLARVRYPAGDVAVEKEAGIASLSTSRFVVDRGLVALRRSQQGVEIVLVDVESPSFGVRP